MKLYEVIPSWVSAIYGMFAQQAANATDALPDQALTVFNNTVLNDTLPQTPIVEPVVEAATSWWSMFSSASASAQSAWQWGTSVTSYAASFIKNLFMAGSESTLAFGRTSQTANLMATTVKNSLEYTDALGIALYETLLEVSPQLVADILKKAEQRINQEDQNANRDHPPGWGIATIAVTATSIYLAVSLLKNLARKTKNHDEFHEMKEQIVQMMKMQNNQSFWSYIYEGAKTCFYSAALLSLGSAFAAPMMASVGLAAIPVAFPIIKWGWTKITEKGEEKELMEIVTAIKAVQEVQSKITTDRAKAEFVENARRLAFEQAKTGDSTLLMKLLDDASKEQGMPVMVEERRIAPVTPLRAAAPQRATTSVPVRQNSSMIPQDIIPPTTTLHKAFRRKSASAGASDQR